MADDLEFVLEQIQIIRPGPRHAPWRPAFVVIGTVGSEELFVVDDRTDEAPILVFDLEAGELRPLAPDFEAWLARLRA